MTATKQKSENNSLYAGFLTAAAHFLRFSILFILINHIQYDFEWTEQKNEILFFFSLQRNEIDGRIKPSFPFKYEKNSEFK